MERNHILTSIVIIFFVHYYSFVSFVVAAAGANNNIITDQDALLALKAHITYDPKNLLSKNWSTNTSICKWIGVTCDFQYPYRVTALNISSLHLTGTIPPHVGNLSSLQTFDLSDNLFLGGIPSSIFNLSSLKTLFLNNNRLSGEIPKELGNLAELQHLSLSLNALTGTIPSIIFNISSLITIDFARNSLSSILPDNICRCLPVLRGLRMSHNRLTGPIPHRLWQCKVLRVLSLSSNQFTGSIPRDIGNLTLLNQLRLGDNNLTAGRIPHEIGNLRNLEILSLHQINRVGAVPATIFNISTMKEIIFDQNKLSGNLPSTIDLWFPNLEWLSLWGNYFNGTIPSSIDNISKLSVIDMGSNSFSGFIPCNIGNLSSLNRLRLANNYLTSSPDLSFLSSISKCKKLEKLNLGNNPLNGILPSFTGNLSISLEKLSMSDCNIRGSIPKEIGNLKNIMHLGLQDNELTGSIPVTLGGLQKLQGLYLGYNKLEGFIPADLCHLGRLDILYLDGNNLSGRIPACIGNLTALRDLSLGSNSLSSSIPETLWKLKHILHLDLSSNSLSGPFPADIGKLKVVIDIDLSRNHLSGHIPAIIGCLTDLQSLSLGYNKLQGPIPESVGDMISLQSLDLSSNNLSGVIPKSLEALLYLKRLNLSFNQLEGEIPTGGHFAKFSAESFVGNHALCGSPRLHVSPCKTSTHKISRATVLLIILPLSAVLTVTLISLLLWRRSQKRRKKLPNDAEMLPQASWRRISYQELLRATDGFSQNNLLGTGGFASVYKGILEDGTEVAVKVFHLELQRALKSFDTECEIMSRIRHRNLIKIITSCSNNDFKALVFGYMSNGSLEKCLHSNNIYLDFLQRLNIMIDVASALEYLHSGYSIPIVHCDLKPSNVLLDENMVGHLSDFGISKLLDAEASVKRTETLATIGYVAPEYGGEGKVSKKSDVYSYGIMLMETFTRRKPTDEFFSEEMSLKLWVSKSLHNTVMEVLDADLLGREDRHFKAKEECVLSILSLAMECTRESTEERIDIKVVVAKLLKIRAKLLANTNRRRYNRQPVL